MDNRDEKEQEKHNKLKDEKENDESKANVPDLEDLTARFQTFKTHKENEDMERDDIRKKNAGSVQSQLFKRESGIKNKIYSDIKEYCYVAVDNSSINMSDYDIQKTIYDSMKDKEESVLSPYLFQEKAYDSPELAVKVLKKKSGVNTSDKNPTADDILIFKIEGNSQDVTGQLANDLSSSPKIASISNLDESKEFTADEVGKSFDPDVGPSFF